MAALVAARRRHPARPRVALLVLVEEEDLIAFARAQMIPNRAIHALGQAMTRHCKRDITGLDGEPQSLLFPGEHSGNGK